MKNNSVASQLDDCKYILALLKPFAVLSSICGILIFSSDYFQKQLVQWILIVWFYGGLAAFFGLVFGPSIWKPKLGIAFRSNIVLTSTTVCLTVFTLGVFFELLPDRSHHKYLMPNTYKVKLKEGDYSVWYYPKWNNTIFDMRVLGKYKDFLPIVTIKSTQDNSVQIEQSEFHRSSLWGKHSAIRIGEIRISKSGIYELMSNTVHDSDYVIALVQARAERSNRINDPPFAGFDDEHLEKQW